MLNLFPTPLLEKIKKLIGLEKEQLLLSKTKVNVVLVGLSQLLELLKAHYSLMDRVWFLFLNNTWLTVQRMVTKVAMVVLWTLLLNSLNKMVFQQSNIIPTRLQIKNANKNLALIKFQATLTLKTVMIYWTISKNNLFLLLLMLQISNSTQVVFYLIVMNTSTMVSFQLVILPLKNIGR